MTRAERYARLLGLNVRQAEEDKMRDYFAAHALANEYTNSDNVPQNVAKWAYDIADAMISERAARIENRRIS